MTLLQNSNSLPDLAISSSSPNDNTISTDQLTPSICNGFKLNLTDERDEHPRPTVASFYAPRPTNALPSLAVPGETSSLSSHTTSTATPLDGPMDPPHPHFKSHMLGDGLLPTASLPSTQPSSDATEARFGNNGGARVIASPPTYPLEFRALFGCPKSSSADSATSSRWVYRHAEELQEVRLASNHSWVPGRFPSCAISPTFSNPFSDTIADAWATPSGFASTPPHTTQESSVREMSSEHMLDDREHAQRMADSCKEDAKGVFVLSALLTAIVATFLLDSYKMLHPAILEMPHRPQLPPQ
ncbi:hypothetical protein BC826DRAFT_1184994 [Russula brevipes]|nr:hypothetical protein BC826DRAFT_1184994 [Russula brevipes]